MIEYLKFWLAKELTGPLLVLAILLVLPVGVFLCCLARAVYYDLRGVVRRWSR